MGCKNSKEKEPKGSENEANKAPMGNLKQEGRSSLSSNGKSPMYGKNKYNIDENDYRRYDDPAANAEIVHLKDQVEFLKQELEEQRAKSVASRDSLDGGLMNRGSLNRTRRDQLYITERANGFVDSPRNREEEGIENRYGDEEEEEEDKLPRLNGVMSAPRNDTEFAAVYNEQFRDVFSTQNPSYGAPRGAASAYAGGGVGVNGYNTVNGVIVGQERGSLVPANTAGGFLLGSTQEAVERNKYYDYAYDEQDQNYVLTPRLHNPNTRLRNFQLTAGDILQQAPPPPDSHLRNAAVLRMKREAMGNPKEIGTWAWWAKTADGSTLARDGAALSCHPSLLSLNGADSAGGGFGGNGNTSGKGKRGGKLDETNQTVLQQSLVKLRGLRDGLEAQMVDDGSPVALDVSYCNISPEGCHALSALLSSPRISHTQLVTTLDLSNNPIGDEGLSVILQSLTNSAQEYQRLPLPILRKLVLSKCELKNCGLLLALHLFYGEIILFPDLDYMDLSQNSRITPDSFRTILEACCSDSGAGSTLRYLDFSDCCLPPLAMIYLQDTLKLMHSRRTSLHVIAIANHHFSSSDAEKLQEQAPPGLIIAVDDSELENGKIKTLKG